MDEVLGDAPVDQMISYGPGPVSREPHVCLPLWSGIPQGIAVGVSLDGYIPSGVKTPYDAGDPVQLLLARIC